MASQINITLCSNDLCEQIEITEQELVEIVTHGIVKPRDLQANEWQFDAEVVAIVARANRLRRDLQINWSGVALALDLLDEVEGLRRENALLRRRLERFEEP